MPSWTPFLDTLYFTSKLGDVKYPKCTRSSYVGLSPAAKQINSVGAYRRCSYGNFRTCFRISAQSW